MGIFGFRDLTKVHVRCGIQENAVYFNGKRDFTAKNLKHRMPDVFACMLGIPEIIHLRGQMRMNQGRIKCCLRTNLTVECALLINFC